MKNFGKAMYDKVAISLGYQPEQLPLPGVDKIQPVVRNLINPVENFQSFIRGHELSEFPEDKDHSEKDYQQFLTTGKIMLAQWMKINNCLAGDEKKYFDYKSAQNIFEGMKILEISGDKNVVEMFENLGAEVTLISPYAALVPIKDNDKRRTAKADLMAGALADLTSVDTFDVINVDRNYLYPGFATEEEWDAEKPSQAMEKVMDSINKKVYRKIVQFGLLTEAKPAIAVESFVKNLSK